jgi:very-short-patch-repair endonuclease
MENNNILYKRNCPKCGKELFTKNTFWNNKAIKENRVCLSCANKSHIITDKWKENMRKNHADISGDKNPFFGKEHSNETKEKLRKCNLGKDRFSDEYKNKLRIKMTGDGNHFYGKKHTDATKEKLSIPKTLEHRRKLALSLKGNPSPLRGKHHSDESKRKMRISAIKRIRENKFIGREMYPSVNPKEKNYFLKLEEKNNWNGIFFGKDNKQFLIENLGYFVDYYEPDKNIIVEYDETNHYDKNWKLKEKDIKRQNEIIKTLHCKFYRYNEVLDKFYEVILDETNNKS